MSAGVLAELMEEEVVNVVGAKASTTRNACRPHGTSRRGDARRPPVQVGRPRVRSADGRAELPLQTYAHFADRDPLTKSVLERMLAGVSTRRYRRTRRSARG